MKTVAVIGASPDRHKFGNKAVRAFAEAGYRVFPVTPHHAAIEGFTAYRSVLDVPEPLDMITIYVPAAIGEQLVDEIAEKGAGEIWVNPGAESDALIARFRARGLRPTEACSIVGLGLNPGRF